MSSRIAELVQAEQERFRTTHPRSAALYKRGEQSFLYGVPLHWMRRWAGGFPPFVAEASGARIVDVDGFDYADFALGDSGAMCGHGPAPVTEAVVRQMSKGATMMLPTEDAVWVGEELQRRFSLPYWGFTTSATDANRACLRIARMVTGRRKVLVFAGCYHGAVDEAMLTLRKGVRMLRNNVHANGLEHDEIAEVVQFNDLSALEAALGNLDVACILTEPFMTNYGMIPPVPGFLQGMEALAKHSGTLLIYDETHTFSSGPQGYVGQQGLKGDMYVLGKSIGGGVPVAVYGLSQDVAERMWFFVPRVNPLVKQSANLGFGGTLAGAALAVAAVRAALTSILTPANFDRMHARADQLATEARQVIAEYDLPWHVTQIGARTEYMFCRQPPRNADEVLAASDNDLEVLLHAFFLNRGVLITPFHNMCLVCPATTEEEVGRHTGALREFAQLLTDHAIVPKTFGVAS